MGIKYKKLHAFPNYCILYKKEFEWLKNFMCQLSRYKLKNKDEDNSHGMTKDVLYEEGV